MKLAIILKSLINEHGLTVTQLSKRSTVPIQTLHNWLTGMEPRSLSQVRKVANYFNVSLDYICFGTQVKTSQQLEEFSDEINAGVFEVVLRKVKK